MYFQKKPGSQDRRPPVLMVYSVYSGGCPDSRLKNPPSHSSRSHCLSSLMKLNEHLSNLSILYPEGLRRDPTTATFNSPFRHAYTPCTAHAPTNWITGLWLGMGGQWVCSQLISTNCVTEALHIQTLLFLLDPATAGKVLNPQKIIIDLEAFHERPHSSAFNIYIYGI